MYAVRWAKMAALYFIIGSGLGMFMAITQLYQYTPVHAHLNLLGWVSMGLFAALYKLFPALEESKLAPWHFWIHQLFFPIFQFALFLIVSSNPLGDRIIPFGAPPTVISILIFGISVWLNVRVPASQPIAAARKGA